MSIHLLRIISIQVIWLQFSFHWWQLSVCTSVIILRPYKLANCQTFVRSGESVVIIRRFCKDLWEENIGCAGSRLHLLYILLPSLLVLIFIYQQRYYYIYIPQCLNYRCVLHKSIIIHISLLCSQRLLLGVLHWPCNLLLPLLTFVSLITIQF